MYDDSLDDFDQACYRNDYNSVIDDKINSYQEFKDYGSAAAPDYNSMIYDTINSDQEFKDFQVKRQDHEVITDSGPKFYGVQIDFQDHGTMTTTGADFRTDHAVHQQTGVT